MIAARNIGAGPGGRARRGGFTVVELLVVVAILLLLLAILVPIMSKARYVAYDAICRSNLHQIANALMADAAADNGELTEPSAWIDAARSQGCAGDVLHCPLERYQLPETLASGDDDDDDDSSGSSSDDYVEKSLEDIYILQFHTNSLTNYDVSYLPDILRRGGSAVQDPQVWCWYPAGGIHDNPKGETWVGFLPELSSNQAFIGIDNDASVLITLGDEISLQYWRAPHAGHSRHWVVRGDGTIRTPLAGGANPGDGDDEVLLTLDGWGNTPGGGAGGGGGGAGDDGGGGATTPVILVNSHASSYGMNGTMGGKRWRPSQLMLLDAHRSRIDVDGAGNMEHELDEVVAPRHFGRFLNVVDAAGAARPMSYGELEEEIERPNGLWRHQ